jgi:hypothetical protein
MSDRGNKFARGIKCFIEYSFTDLVKSMTLSRIGLFDT